MRYGRYTRRKFLRDSALFCAGMTGIALAGCTTTTTPIITTTVPTTTVATTVAPKMGGTLKMNRWATVTDIDPRTGDPKNGPLIWGYVLQKLVSPLPDGTTENVLCEDYQESPNFKTIHFNLRDGVKFHDGTDFTAQDVKDQMEVIIKVQPQNPKMRYTNFFADLQSVDVNGDLEITFNLKNPVNYFIENLYTYQTGYIVPSSYMTNTQTQTTLIGTGPYKVDTYQSGVTSTLSRVENHWSDGMDSYWTGKCYIDKILSNMSLEEAVRVAALKAGEADLIDFTSYDTFKSVQSEGGPYTFYEKVGDDYMRCIINVRNPPLNEEDFRKALIMGINWDTYISILSPGSPKVYDLFEGTPFAYPDIDELKAMYPTYNPTEAARIVNVYKNAGKLRPINLMYDPTVYGGVHGDFLATEYPKVGITINLIQKPAQETANFRRSNAFMPADPVANPNSWWDLLPASSEFGGKLSPRSAVYNPFYSTAGFVPEPDGKSTNYAGIRDGIIDSWIDESGSANIARRKELYNLIQKRVIQKAYHVPQSWTITRYASTNKLEGLSEDIIQPNFRNNYIPIVGLWLNR